VRPGSVAIVGAAETESVNEAPHVPEIELHAQAALRALADAGMTLADVDGYANATPHPLELVTHLGIRPRWIDSTRVGGCSFMVLVRHAALALSAGWCDVAMITHGESGRSGCGRSPYPRQEPTSLWSQFEVTYGAGPMVFNLTVPARRFLADRGMGSEDLAAVVVAQREWAADVPQAVRRERTTVDEVLAAPMVADPFTRPMCCVRTDGGGALVMVRTENVGDWDSPSAPVYLLGSGEAAESGLMSQMDDISTFGGFRRSSSEAFRSAGVGHEDVDHLMIYDAFAHVPLYGLEDLGFVGRGESGAFVTDGHTRPGGALPLNTNGGGLCYTHTGMYGMFAIQESVRQVRGEAAVPVPGVEVSFVQGLGYAFGAAAALVLSVRAS
jgi:acetyl-CoA acetyltransferase